MRIYDRAGVGFRKLSNVRVCFDCVFYSFNYLHTVEFVFYRKRKLEGAKVTEKELGIFICECVNGLPDSGDNGADCMTLAKALIQRYPQILAEKVETDGDAHVSLDGTKILAEIQIPFMKWFNKEFEVFIREVVE